MKNRLALGTVQFGLKYGVNNSTGKIPAEEAFKILDFAWDNGIDILDTAYVYGDSEKILGEFITNKGIDYKVVSKLAYSGLEGYSSAKECLLKTLARLKQDKIYGYLIHRLKDIYIYQNLIEELKCLKKEGLVEKIGFSIYWIEEIKHLLDSNIDFDILEIPYNIFDQRFEEYFPVVKGLGVDIYARSVFLQGLFFMEIEKFTGNFQSAKKDVQRLRQLSSENGIPMHFLCLCFALLNLSIDRVIIGVDSLEQLRQNLGFAEYMDRTKSVYNLLKEFRIDNEELIIPVNWK